MRRSAVQDATGGWYLSRIVRHPLNKDKSRLDTPLERFVSEQPHHNETEGRDTYLPTKEPGEPLPSDSYRPISLLTIKYKPLARIMSQRLKPILAEQLPTGQYCGVRDAQFSMHWLPFATS